MNAKEFLAESGITQESLGVSEIEFKLILTAMDVFATKKQMETFDTMKKVVKDVLGLPIE